MMQNQTGGFGGLFGAGRAKPYAGPRMNDEFGMMSPEEIERGRRAVEERRRRARSIRDQFGDTVEQRRGKLYGSGNELLGTIETGLGGATILNTDESTLSKAQAEVKSRIDKINEQNASLGQDPITAEEEDRFYKERGISRFQRSFR
tara:strand:+ start:3517 stop:3957 length:441 start_codon:yes stop_codon:yes gene_type:complete